MSAVLRWETPPPSRLGRPRGTRSPQPDPRAAIAEELRAHPGHWGVVFEGPDGQAGGLAANIREGRTRTWQPAGAFDAVARSNSDKTTVYARYVGDARAVLDTHGSQP